MSIMKTSLHEPASGQGCVETPSRSLLVLALGNVETAIEAR
jgi:hypothetical protein